VNATFRPSSQFDDISVTQDAWTETVPEVGHWEPQPDEWVVDTPAWTEHVPAEGEVLPIFTGRITDIRSSYPFNKTNGTTRTSVEVTVADAVQIHGSTMRYGVDLGVATNETFESRISRLAGSANAPVEIPVVGAPIVRYSF
jgi:hypothetical protein